MDDDKLRKELEDLRWRRSAPWHEIYLVDMCKQREVSHDWAKAAEYHLSGSQPGKVRSFKPLDWHPTHIDEKARLIDQADVWCSAEINGKPCLVLVSMGDTIEVEVSAAMPGVRAPWR